jgi:hypothetical protein
MCDSQNCRSCRDLPCKLAQDNTLKFTKRQNGNYTSQSEEDGNKGIHYTDVVCNGSHLRRRWWMPKFWHFHGKQVAKLYAAHQE